MPLIGAVAGGSGVAALAVGGSSGLAITLSFALPLLIGGALTILCIRGTRRAAGREPDDAVDQAELVDALEAGLKLARTGGRETRIPRRSAHLSAREREVLMLIADGLSPREIAAELSVPTLVVVRAIRRIRQLGTERSVPS